MKSFYKQENIHSLNPSIISAAVFVSLGILSVVFFSIYGNYVQDDAYITFRYARNIARGLGFVFNPGELVLGTTTPLFTLLLAAVAWITKLDVALISRFICSVSLWLSSCLLYKICEPHGKAFSLAASLLYLTSPFLPHFNGMESYFLLFLFLWANYMYQRNWRIFTAILSGLLILVRYEMIFLIFLIGAADFTKTRKLPFWLLPGFLPFIGWAIYAFNAFGSPVPLSASVKLVAPHIPFLVGFVFYWFSFLKDNIINSLVLIFIVFGVWKYIRARNAYQNFEIIFLFSLIYLVVAAFIAGSFPWYYAPLLPGISIAVAIGLVDVSKLLAQSIAKKILPHTLSFSTFLPLILVMLMFTGLLQSWFSNYRQFQGQYFDSRYELYRNISDWLIDNSTKDQSLATLEIGYIGYFSDMEIVDLYGLVSPELFPYVSKNSEETLYKSLLLLSPDFILFPMKDLHESIYYKTGFRYKFIKEFNKQYYLYQKENE